MYFRPLKILRLRPRQNTNARNVAMEIVRIVGVIWSFRRKRERECKCTIEKDYKQKERNQRIIKNEQENIKHKQQWRLKNYHTRQQRECGIKEKEGVPDLKKNQLENKWGPWGGS